MPASRMTLVCLECDKRFTVAVDHPDPRCPKCRSVDLEVAE